MKLIKKYHKWRIDKAQKEVVELMKSEGYSDKVLEKQAAIASYPAFQNDTAGECAFRMPLSENTSRKKRDRNGPGRAVIIIENIKQTCAV